MNCANEQLEKHTTITGNFLRGLFINKKNIQSIATCKKENSLNEHSRSLDPEAGFVSHCLISGYTKKLIKF